MKRESIERYNSNNRFARPKTLEAEIDACADMLLLLCSPGCRMTSWALIVSKFHALNIKLAQVKGERVEANYSKSDYII
jgi:hypothetical protein